MGATGAQGPTGEKGPMGSSGIIRRSNFNQWFEDAGVEQLPTINYCSTKEGSKKYSASQCVSQ